jgi:hypothetical protein
LEVSEKVLIFAVEETKYYVELLKLKMHKS